MIYVQGRGMHTYISVVAHNDADIIIQYGSFAKLAKLKNVTIVITDNTPTPVLAEFCNDNNIHYLANKQQFGFSKNNNNNFDYSLNCLGMQSHDGFLLLNPDVVLTSTNFESLLTEVRQSGFKFATVDLYLNNKLTDRDDSVRNFPRLIDFFSSYILQKNHTILARENIKEACEIDWCSGAFMYFTAGHYQALGGFDESYYLYCEDIDICLRSSRLGVAVYYLPNIVAIHRRRCRSRQILSKHFCLHVMGVIRFLIKKNATRISKKRQFNLFASKVE